MGSLMRAVAALLVVALLASAAAADGKPRVVATFTIIGDLTQALGGDAIELTTLVGPDADAHVFEPKPSAVATVARADLIVANGLGMEPWLERLTEAADYRGKVLTASDGVVPLPFKEGADGTGAMPDDPHAFQDLANGQIYVKNIEAALAKLVAPADLAPMHIRAAALESEMAKLDAELKEQIGALPAENRRILTSHDAFHYFARAYGLDILSIQGISTDTEPAAADLAAIARQAKAGKVRAIFLENMSNPQLVNAISSESGVPVGGELVADALTKPDGVAPHYLDMFRHNLAELLKVLR